MLARRAGGEAVFEAEMLDVPQRARTGDLPAETRVAALVREAHARYAASQDGTVADYIPILGEADPRLFGLSLAEVDGTVHRSEERRVGKERRARWAAEQAKKKRERGTSRERIVYELRRCLAYEQ